MIGNIFFVCMVMLFFFICIGIVIYKLNYVFLMGKGCVMVFEIVKMLIFVKKCEKLVVRWGF